MEYVRSGVVVFSGAPKQYIPDRNLTIVYSPKFKEVNHLVLLAFYEDDKFYVFFRR
jgi:hypothetical protein